MNSTRTGDPIQSSSSTAAAPPRDMDIICGRGKDNTRHKGNLRFEGMIRNYMAKYKSCRSKIGKTNLTLDILADLRQEGVSFVKLNKLTGQWDDIGDKAARLKISQTFREIDSNPRRGETVRKLPVAESRDVMRLLNIQRKIFFEMVRENNENLGPML